MNITPLVAGNWKMHKTPSDGKSFVSEAINLLLDIEYISVIFSPPFTGLFDMDVSPPFFKAAQNCHWQDLGAFTGEISVPMVKDCGASYVILGHSERRHIFGEMDREINRKVHAVLNGGLKPILCIGETLEDRKAQKTADVLRKQLIEGLSNLTSVNNIIIAYEPVWAIGTGITAEEDQIKSAHTIIREILFGNFKDIDSLPIIYGGSVKSSNAGTLIQIDGVNGFLIGSGSLDLTSFISIVNCVEQYQMRK
tara:strand:+ start:4996 stop:5751 length:756 start_codon:yes stop_codon:yes gene_type:complete